MQNLEKKENLAAIRPQIQFISEVEEMTVPRRVRLTKSENGETGTATFLFFEPTIFSVFINSSSQNSICIKNMNLIWDKKKISTKDIKIYFKDGKPTILRSILIFRNSKDWLNFLNFMSCYSKETGLSFTEFK